MWILNWKLCQSPHTFSSPLPEIFPSSQPLPVTGKKRATRFFPFRTFVSSISTPYEGGANISTEFPFRRQKVESRKDIVAAHKTGINLETREAKSIKFNVNWTQMTQKDRRIMNTWAEAKRKSGRLRTFFYHLIQSAAVFISHCASGPTFFYLRSLSLP